MGLLEGMESTAGVESTMGLGFTKNKFGASRGYEANHGYDDHLKSRFQICINLCSNDCLTKKTETRT